MDTTVFWSGTAVITGAGSGLGLAMANRFAAAGMAIVCLDFDGDRAEAAARAIRDGGGRARAICADVADRAALLDAAEATEREFGACNVLCANVGVQQFGAIDRLSAEEWRWVLDVNVLGTVAAVDAFLPLMRRSSGNRRIALTASVSALLPGARLGAYNASKFAVMGIGETLRIELAQEDIGVSVFFPAGMTTRHTESSQLARPPGLPGRVFTDEDLAAMKASRKMDVTSHVASPLHATRNLLRDLAANERFIISHGDFGADLDARLSDIRSAVARAQDG